MRIGFRSGREAKLQSRTWICGEESSWGYNRSMRFSRKAGETGCPFGIVGIGGTCGRTEGSTTTGWIASASRRGKGKTTTTTTNNRLDLTNLHTRRMVGLSNSTQLQLLQHIHTRLFQFKQTQRARTFFHHGSHSSIKSYIFPVFSARSKPSRCSGVSFSNSFTAVGCVTCSLIKRGRERQHGLR